MNHMYNQKQKPFTLAKSLVTLAPTMGKSNPSQKKLTAEELRLHQSEDRTTHWKRWGPYLAERAWGTVREDYSKEGTAWEYFPHDHARSKAYRWNEDGIAGISDRHQKICFSIAMWNGRDPILKERLFGLTGNEGNHGEDCKECYFYLDSTPTHSYMKYLYKYPQAAYPYVDLIETNRRRNRQECEYELLDTGVFDQERYFDVFVEYAKASPEDILIQITVENRGPEPATLHVLPTLWFRSVSSSSGNAPRPLLRQAAGDAGVIAASHPELGERLLHAEGAAALLFTENETNNERLFGAPNRTPYVKDGIDNYIVHGRQEAVNPEKQGTKASAHYPLTVGAGESRTLRLRLGGTAPAGTDPKKLDPFRSDFDAVMRARRPEADEFHAAVIPASLNADAARVMRQALAGMLWSKQFYYYDVDRWLTERGADPFSPNRRAAPRNDHLHHMNDAAMLSVPDKW